MKYLCLFIFISFISCKDLIKNEIALDNSTEKIDFGVPDITLNKKIISKSDLLGYWVGNFDADLSRKEINNFLQTDTTNNYSDLHKKITFSIDKISGNSIEGHSVVSGNIVAFKGELKKTNKAFRLIVNELQNKKTNGKFLFEIAVGDTTLTGNWTAYNKIEVPIYKKKLSLQKRFFLYNPENKLEYQFSDETKHKKVELTYDEEDSLGNIELKKYEDEGIFTTTSAIDSVNPSKELLKKAFVENLSKGDIYIMRNLIFARHGFSFKEKKIRSYFDEHSWYMPVFSDVKKDLTELEKKNIDLLLRYEQNAKEYYDVFGR